jgi:hypothetical protein
MQRARSRAAGRIASARAGARVLSTRYARQQSNKHYGQYAAHGLLLWRLVLEHCNRFNLNQQVGTAENRLNAG